MYKKLSTIKITDYDNAYIVEKDESISWKDSKVQKELEKIGVVFDSGCHAIKIIQRKGMNPLFALGMEDDSRIYFNKHKGIYVYQFDMALSGDLVSKLNVAINRVRDI